MRIPKLICRRLLVQVMSLALFLAAPKTGNSRAARMAIMAITINNSMMVKPLAALKLLHMKDGQCRKRCIRPLTTHKPSRAGPATVANLHHLDELRCLPGSDSGELILPFKALHCRTFISTQRPEIIYTTQKES